MSGGKGFTVIELMVVVAIIALLASIILVSLKSSQDKARLSRAQTEMGEIVRSILIAQGEAGKPLNQITVGIANDCPSTAPGSSCVCEPNPTTDPQCRTDWKNSLIFIENATNGAVANLANFENDPWGRPYILDENEKSGSCSTKDTLTTCGPKNDATCSEKYVVNIGLSGYCP